MVLHERLNDAAIALYQTLHEAGIKHGIVGGYAIGCMGGPRASKDVDCIAAASKEQAIQLLDGKNGFQWVGQSRMDYVAFLWSDLPDRAQPVLVEIFPETFPGSRYTMQNIQPQPRVVTGSQQTSGTISLLDPALIFKGKLRAAATRAKFSDAVDLRWLENNYASLIRAKRDDLDITLIGMAMKRHAGLNHLFMRLGVDIHAAESATADFDPSQLVPTRPGDVQTGMLKPGSE